VLFAALQSSTLDALAQADGAENSPTTTSKAHSDPVDVVRLKNGGLLRGTISELVPGEYVVIVLTTGETRKLSMTSVDYAGPTGGAPAREQGTPATAGASASHGNERQTASHGAPATRHEAASPLVPNRAQEVRVSFRANEPNVSFYLKTSDTARAGHARRASGFTLLCTAPCEASLPEGPYIFGLAKDDRAPVLAKLVTISGSRSLMAQYTDNSEVRRVGWALFGASIGVGILIYGIGESRESECEGKAIYYDDGALYSPPPGDCKESGLKIAGTLVALAGGTLGLVLGLRRDDAQVSAERAGVTRLRAGPRFFRNLSRQGERVLSPGFSMSVSF
jgi:hypothetical protein